MWEHFSKDEGQRRQTILISLATDSRPDAVRSRAADVLGALAWQEGQRTEALAWWERSAILQHELACSLCHRASSEPCEPRNPHLLASTLQALAQARDADVRRAIAANPTTPHATLELLSAERAPWVRRGAAANPAMPREVLERLSEDPDFEVQELVAANPSTPESALARLALSEKRRESVAGNAAAPLALITQLATDGSAAVRAAVGANWGTPLDVLRGLRDRPGREDFAGQIRGTVDENPMFEVKQREQVHDDRRPLHRYTYTSVRIYRHDVRVPTGMAATDIDLNYLTLRLSSSLGTFQSGSPDVTIFEGVFEELSGRQGPLDRSQKVLFQAVQFTSRVDLPRPVDLSEFQNSLTWETEVACQLQDVELLSSEVSSSTEALAEVGYADHGFG